MGLQGLEIFKVEPDSIAAELGLEPGDQVVRLNGEPVRDMLDLRFLEADENLQLIVIKGDGTQWEMDIEKDYEEILGLDFGPYNFGKTSRCANRCLFCFVEQMPPNMRRTLYVKDDDYRLSFWHGNFITLTNLREDHWRRIAQQRLSPLYISVHTTNPKLRQLMMGNKIAGRILEQLRYLAKAGIEMHTQVVLCPGLNDREELQRTLADLSGLWPAVRSMAIVPVGLTKFRASDEQLRSFRPEEAAQVLQWVIKKQDDFMARWDNPFIFAADEFFLLSGMPIPAAERYADFPQLENGVGLTRLFLDEWELVKADLPRQVPKRKVTLATSVLGAKALRPLLEELNAVPGLEVAAAVIINRFFGERITVTGLITGRDLLAQLVPEELGDLLVVPAVMLKKEESLFLDDLTLADLAEKLGKPIAVADGPRQLLDAIISSVDHEISESFGGESPCLSR